MRSRVHLSPWLPVVLALVAPLVIAYAYGLTQVSEPVDIAVRAGFLVVILVGTKHFSCTIGGEPASVSVDDGDVWVGVPA